ncbi:MAG: thiosulfate oxidation carrier protein SoxY [Alphaproteobacteria bacterium]|nr:thiosulfate oxidation carrier protein SoxY [Alphaproteobacteria bacterium]
MSRMESPSQVSRRHVLVLTGAAAAAAGAGLLPGIALADKAGVEAAIRKAVGGATLQSGRITLELPQIAENGNTVPIGIEVDSPMTGSDYVKSVHIFAEGNPNPEVASIHFTPTNGIAKASTRMRLLKTQNVVAVAEMSDGSVYREAVEVKVTIGGCGG